MFVLVKVCVNFNRDCVYDCESERAVLWERSLLTLLSSFTSAPISPLPNTIMAPVKSFDSITNLFELS